MSVMMKNTITIARMIFRAVEMCIFVCLLFAALLVAVAEVEELDLLDVVDVECDEVEVECELVDVECEVVDVAFEEVVARSLSSA